MAEQSQKARDEIWRLAMKRRSQDAQWQRNSDGKSERGGHQPQCHWQPLGYQTERGRAMPKRVTEVAANGPLEKCRVLQRNWLVQAHLVAEVGDLLGRGTDRQEHRCGVSGQPGETEDHD